MLSRKETEINTSITINDSSKEPEINISVTLLLGGVVNANSVSAEIEIKVADTSQGKPLATEISNSIAAGEGI
ncbi:Protein eyes shut [Frankliniella fusca]|nr:Protein eyes shut [Frankliniella fusca]